MEAGLNQFGGSQTANRVVVTVGKFSVPDMFDTITYAHDPRNDFMNWSLVDAGTFDYAADAWGFTYGAAVEWYQGNWTRAPACSICRSCPTASSSTIASTSSRSSTSSNIAMS